MSLKVLVVHSGRLGIGGANVFLQDLLSRLSKIAESRFYLVGMRSQSGVLQLELGMVENGDNYGYTVKVYNFLRVSSFNNILEKVSKFMEGFISALRPSIMLVNSVEPIVLSVIEKVMDKIPKLYLIVHDGGFFCPLKHMWDPIKGRPCSMPCLALGEPPGYCAASEVLLKIGYIQPFFNPLKPRLLSPAEKISVDKNFQDAWEISRTVLRHSNVIVPSKFMASIVKRFAGVNAVIIRHGAPEELFALAREPRRTAHVRLGFVGDVSLHKGVHVLLEAVDLVVRRRKGLARSATFYIAGKVHNLSSVSIRIVSKYKYLLRKHVHLLGFIRSRVSVYKLLDVVILPSICYENAPLTIIEGVASGRYVIASNVGGVPEYLSPYPRGLLVEPGNAHALAEAIEQTIDRIIGDKDAFGSLDTHRYVKTTGDAARMYARLLFGAVENAG